MPSLIDPSNPVDGAPAVKADLRANLQAVKDEIVALQIGKTDLGHQHLLADGALASKDIVQSEDIATAAITTEKLAAGCGGTPPLVAPVANAVDIYAFMTRDGGATWYGSLGGKGFS